MMAEKRRPWGKWYWGDWRKDARLRRCSYAARGLWVDMLSLMGGECDPFGFLIMEGQALGPDDLAGLLGGSSREIEKMLAELEGKNVFSRVGGDLPGDVTELVPDGLPSGTILSRRMLRDKAKEEKDSTNGKNGGNPRLKANPNGGVNPGDKAQRLEARDQKPEDASLRSATRARGDPDQPEFADFWERYPEKIGKAAARKAFVGARRKASPAEILAGLERYIAAKPPDRPWCNPATFLNQERWLDEPAPLIENRGNSHANRSNGPATKLFEGAALALAERDERRQRERNREADHDLAVPLLDR
jgi:hypothetical protein